MARKDVVTEGIREDVDYKLGPAVGCCHLPLQGLGRVLLQLVISSVQGLCLMAAPCLVYKALGLSGTAWYHVLTISFLLFVSASYAPLPGATGAQEGGFVVFFAGIFGEEAAVGLLIWRFATFYPCLLIGCADTVFISSREPRPCVRAAVEDRK